jgi:hypothetical protein
MAYVSGEEANVIFTAQKTYSKTLSNFLYQVDFKYFPIQYQRIKPYVGAIADVAVYDIDNSTKINRYIQADLPNDKMLIYFAADASDTQNRKFAICVGAAINETNSSSVFSTAAYDDYYPFGEFTDTSTTARITSGSVAYSTKYTPATLGNDSIFGQSARNTGSGSGYIKGRYSTIPTSVPFTVEAIGNCIGGGAIFDTKYGTSLYASGNTWGWQSGGGTRRYFIVGQDAWHHVMINYVNSNQSDFYVDGVYVYTGTGGGAPSNPYYFDLLNSAYHTYPLTGYIDFISVSDGNRSVDWAYARHKLIISPSLFWSVKTKVKDLMPIF